MGAPADDAEPVGSAGVGSLAGGFCSTCGPALPLFIRNCTVNDMRTAIQECTWQKAANVCIAHPQTCFAAALASALCVAAASSALLICDGAHHAWVVNVGMLWARSTCSSAHCHCCVTKADTPNGSYLRHGAAVRRHSCQPDYLLDGSAVTHGVEQACCRGCNCCKGPLDPSQDVMHNYTILRGTDCGTLQCCCSVGDAPS